MQQILSVWNALGVRQRIVVVIATVSMMAAVLGLARLASAPNMALLYAGLESGPAGEVVNALETRGVPFEVQAGSIFVPDNQRDTLRLTLASEGLPANGGQGYELLDGLSGFGTTSQMFDAAYWRAKEGELARTIVANPAIATARVHIANSSANPFQRDVTPTASLSVSTTGGILSPELARAFKHLVASAVPGMDPEQVAVIDGRGGLISGEENAATGSSADDRSDRLRERVQRLMEARVGTGNAVVEVSVDTVTESESIRERIFDPDGRVAISTDSEENTDQSQEAGGGDVTVASNLPDGEAGEGGSSTSQSSETRERVNYEVSETTREVLREPGAIRRLTVAVLVNGSYEPAPDGSQQFSPLPEAELVALRALVESAVGYDEARGDRITLRSLPFERPEGLGTGPLKPGLFAGPIDTMRVIQMAILAVVALLLGLFVVRPVLARGGDKASGAAALPAPAEIAEVEADSDLDFDNLPVMGGASDFGGMGMVDFDTEGETTGSADDPVERLRALIEDRKGETVEILRSWLDDKEEAR